MPENQPSLITPEQIVAYNQAFATSLIALNIVASNQRNEIMTMVLSSLDAMIAIAKKTQNAEEAISKLQATASKLKSDTEGAMLAVPSAEANIPPQPAEPVSDAGNWYSEILKTLNLAQHNTVLTQNALYVTGSAALTQIITASTSLIVAAEGKSLASHQ